MDSDKINGSMQENVLTLLAWDDSAAGIIRSVIDTDLFESPMHREVAYHCVEYYNSFNKAPGEHLPDLLEDILDEDDRKASLYGRLLDNIYGLKDSINVEYVLSTLNKFVRQQQLKIGVTEAAKRLKAGDTDEAEVELNKSLKRTLDVFEPGSLFSSDVMRALKHSSDDEGRILLGMPYLDTIRMGPGPKELFLFMAPPNRGKSWFLIHTAKAAAVQGKKVLVVTLEMSEEKYLTRLAQSIFSVSRRESYVTVTNILSDNNSFEGFDFEKINRPVIGDYGIMKTISNKLAKVGPRLNITVKQFPTGRLSMKGLEAYLDQLERWNNYIPDIIIIDYADLMTIDANNLRVSTGNVYKDLRGIAVERNLAVVTASQSNRSGEDATVLTMKHLAEDYSKAATADIVLTYNQTAKEHSLNLARLHVAKNRDEEAGNTILISQQYPIGQFFLSGSFMPKEYWPEIESLYSGGDSDD